jgi:hypothetical protein
MIQEFIESVRSAWCAETSYEPKKWSEANPSYGQCAVTAEAFRKRFGGKIAKGMADGVSHYWNVLDGTHIDITREQFPPETAITVIKIVPKVRGNDNFASRLAALEERLAA